MLKLEFVQTANQLMLLFPTVAQELDCSILTKLLFENGSACRGGEASTPTRPIQRNNYNESQGSTFLKDPVLTMGLCGCQLSHNAFPGTLKIP